MIAIKNFYGALILANIKPRQIDFAQLPRQQAPLTASYNHDSHGPESAMHLRTTHFHHCTPYSRFTITQVSATPYGGYITRE